MGDFISDIITALFSFILDCIMGIVRLICIPLNTAFEGLFPDFSIYVDKIYIGFDYIFKDLSWGLNLIPPGVREVMLFCFTIELSMLVVMRSSHLTAKAWQILQKLKFW